MTKIMLIIATLTAMQSSNTYAETVSEIDCADLRKTMAHLVKAQLDTLDVIRRLHIAAAFDRDINNKKSWSDYPEIRSFLDETLVILSESGRDLDGILTLQRLCPDK